MTRLTQATPPAIRRRADELYRKHNHRIHSRTDRLFAVLLVAEWIAAMGLAAFAGAGVRVAFVGGGLAAVAPMLLAVTAPGKATTRHAVAVGQMLIGALLIHLTGGRIETHFHVFGSLAFLAFYRDWRVLVTATVAVVGEHIVGGFASPGSVYGAVAGAGWRWIEHAGWVAFENLFLVLSCVQGQREMRAIAFRYAQVESAHEVEAQAQAVRRLAVRNEQLASQAIAATQAKSAFLATMSHELRTPMNAIINYADLAVRKASRAIPTSPDAATLRQQHRFAVEIRSAGDRLLTLINQLLDLSKIESGRLQVDLQEARGDEIAARVRKIALPLMTANGNAFEVHCADGIALRTDVQKLEQCLINLLGNAAKFTHNGRVELRMVPAERSDHVQITVSDTGIGMTPEQTDRLFVPFNQADSSITRRYGGSGLGLAITKSMVGLLGGTITVHSERYQGSTFTITTPMDCTREVGPEASAPVLDATPIAVPRSDLPPDTMESAPTPPTEVRVRVPPLRVA